MRFSWFFSFLLSLPYSSVKRYSLAVGPPKKDPKVKGVHSAAVKAFLRRQEEERRKKDLEEKKRKEGLLAKRVELKHDRKARAMASRTKDNFRGYNGIPIEEKPKRRLTGESRSDQSADAVECVTGDDMEESEHSRSESEHESEDYEERPPKTSVKPKAPPPKGAPPHLNFTDLLKLAAKKQYEPVEIKVVKKVEERPMTAEELREREYLERKNRKGAVLKEKKGERETKHAAAPSCSKKDLSQKEFLNAKHSKHSADKHSFSKGSLPSQSGPDKKSKGPALPSKPKHAEKAKHTLKAPLKGSSSTGHSKAPASGEGRIGLSSHTPVLKTAANGAQKQSSVKEPSLKKTISHVKPTTVTAAQHESVKHSSSKQASSGSGAGESLPRAKSSLSTGPGRPASSLSTGRGLQSASSSVGLGRSGSHSGSGQRSSSSSVGPGRPGSSVGYPRPFLPPITSKRQYEDDDEDDSEMEDFIDDEGEPQEEISKHIREIFGYDRSRYKDESDYALRYMESSWKEQQKEEAKSLRLGMLEDLEEQRREEEELKRKKQTKKLRTR
ncbi:UNVERIFIED_CONTAM: hypothetical protein K2H54_060135 [Gekko kuhli]